MVIGDSVLIKPDKLERPILKSIRPRIGYKISFIYDTEVIYVSIWT